MSHMASPIWALVLIIGTACSQHHTPISVRKEKSLDQKPVTPDSKDNSIIAQCDFEDNSKPFCDWTQASADDGNWIRASGPSPMGSIGPPGGYPNGEGYYLHLDLSSFRPSGVVHLRSPPIWEQGPLCVHFAYHMFGLSWGAQLKLLLLMGTKNKHPNLLWKHLNTQSPSWMPAAVTVPTGRALPSQLIFEGVTGSTAYLDISLDAIYIRRGSCSRVCMMQMCSFDTQDNLCGWSWIPTASGAKWVQKKGLSGVPNVGPEDDFSRPGSGFYMLLDPKNAKPKQKSVLLSPLSQSSGCLSLSFHYILHGQSPGAALTIYASVLGSIRKHILFSGQSGPDWQTVSVNYTGQGQIQFIVVGVFGNTPEPAVAVDAISIAPCGEHFPQCDFEDDAHPFCDWVQISGIGGHWTWSGKNMPTQGVHTFGVPLHKGDYIYLEADKFSQAGQSFRLVSPSFCAPGTICVEFTYYMYGLGEDTKLKLLLGSPAGSFLISLWQRVGSQSPGWLNASITIPSGQQQPMQLTLEAIRGTNTAFIVAVGFILINHGTCQGPVPTMPPSKPPVPPAGPSEIPPSTEKLPVPTEKLPVPTEKLPVPTEKLPVPTEKLPVPTEKLPVPTEKLPVPTEKLTVPTEKLPVPTEKLTVPTEKLPVPTEKLTVPTEKLTVPTEKFPIPTEKPTAPTTLIPTGPAASVKPPSAPTTSMTTVPQATATTPSPTPASCPLDAHYERCACPASCKSPKPKCELLCKPGCVCNSGFLFSGSHCINASSCNCFYDNNYYKPGAEWFGPNCTERCHCQPGSRVECLTSQCGKHTVCQLQNNQYRCHPHGTATCSVYGDPHYLTFDGRHFSFMGRCTYILAQSCGNSTEPFFRVVVKNEERMQEGTSCLSEVYVTLPQTTVTLLKDRRTLVGGQQVALPSIPFKGIFLASSGRFVELQTAFGLRVRWDGDQQLFTTVPSTYYSKVCGLCGNYDGESSNDNLMPDGRPARDEDELAVSWQTKEDVNKECQKNKANPPSCNSTLQNTLSGPEFCGRLVVFHGAFEACLPHLMASVFLNNCVLDMCNFQGLQQMLCAHMAALTETCQDAGYGVKPWREPQFCPLDCPPNSKYTMCANMCPDTCHSSFSGMSCRNRCVEGCECNPGFVLSGLQCVPRSQCGCVDSTGSYLMIGQKWFKAGCRELCICEGNNRFRCVLWRCQAQEVCGQQDGIYGCHAQGSATCTVSGDPHYQTFDGALHHFMGTCSYTLTQPCWSWSLDNHFVVGTTNEFQGGNLEVSYVKAVYVKVFNLRISLIKGHKVVLNGRQVALPVWPARGRLSIRLSGSFILLYTDFGLQVRYDGHHLVKVTVPSTYAGRLCGLCGNYNNNSLDDNLKPDEKPATNSIQLGVSWKSKEYSEPGCFFEGVKPPRCQGNEVEHTWDKNCDILTNPLGPFSQCHEVVPPHSSFTSCVYGQCGTKGDALTLCRSLQAYASLCAEAGRAPAWRNSTFCPLRCPSGSSYSPCANPCPATCLSLSPPRDCPAALPCVEGCECQKGYVLSGTSCVPLSQCGCTDPKGSYYPVGESWYTDDTCSRLCSCSTYNNISCLQTSCKPSQKCGPLDGLIRCRAAGMGVCRISGTSHYVSFDGSYHAIRSTCTYVLVKTCHFTMDLPFFKISGENGRREDQSPALYLRQVNINIFDSLIILQKGHRVLINGKQFTLPSTNKVRGVSISASGIYTVLSVYIGLQVKFDGSGFLEIELPRVYYGKVCGMCGNFNGEEEDDLMMPSDELAQNDTEFVDSWQDKEANPTCQQDEQMKTKREDQEELTANCGPDHLARAQEQCHVAFQAPAWAECATHVAPKPFLLRCVLNLCEFRGLHNALCVSLQAFGAACQAQGLKPPIWRNSSFCPLECPPYSTYTTCIPPCSPSCGDPEGQCKDAEVPSPCEEGCICQPGYVLREQQCVPRAQCGCWDAQGRFFPAGKTWLSIDCTRNCTCRAGAIQCHPFLCPPGSHCQPNSSGGKSRCVPHSKRESEQCSVLGDPHYRTFDGLRYHFQGRMTYTLIKTVGTLPSGVARLVVEGRNKMSMPLSLIFLHEIIVMVYGYTVQLQAELQLMVNGQKTATPYNPDEHLLVTTRGHRLYLITDFELVVSFDGRNSAAISLPSTYQGLVRGLCGNFDRNQKNEFMLPNGSLTQNLSDFGNSWEVEIKGGLPHLSSPRAIQEEEYREEKPGSDVSGCSPEHQRLINSTRECRVLVAPQGPFAACHQTVAPEPFQENCMFDQCVTWDPKDQEELRCQVLSGYAITCQEAGTALASWQDHTHCALVYPANTIYQSCMTPGYNSCSNLAAPRDCKGPWVESCVSLLGRIYSATQSLPLTLCGCTNNGIYFQSGDSFVTENCSQCHTCARPEVLLSEPLSCSAGGVCTLGTLTHGCFQESPRLQNPYQNDGHCQEQGAPFTCECDFAHGGDHCVELWDMLSPENPEAACHFVVPLLGMLVAMAVTVLAVIRNSIFKKRRREKIWSQHTQAGRHR
ncbi:zonadhesin [Phyllostomus discolor]|nr:zonadhesin [Phyllostomus discolor]